MHTRNILNILLIALLVAALAWTLLPPGEVSAQAGSAMDLINAVNAYREASGLQPYGVDSSLMSLAQGQSEYQASIQQCTHARADGSGPDAHGIPAENIACGDNISVQYAVYSQWSDQLHTATMLGPETGVAGAGVASSGSTVYYTLDVKNLTGNFNYVPPQQPQQPGSQGSASGAQQEIGQVVTSTPNSDGSIAHVIKYGETLVEIANAYGVSLADLISMNRLDPNKPVYFENQVLIIRLAFTATPYMTATYTPRPPTRTPQPSRTPRPTRTATPFHTPIPTRTPTAEPLVKLPTLQDLGPARPVMAYAFIAISALGLVVLVFTSFLPGKKS